MNYRLYPDSPNDLNDLRGTVFANRKYVPPNPRFDANVAEYDKLANMDKTVELFDRFKDKRMGIIVDADQDGYCSASILYRYIKKHFHNIPSYYLHSSKAHGLSNDLPEIKDIDLLIIPDAGTSDTSRCQELQDKGIEILILDHHIPERENPYAVIVNNQCCDYPNKELCGTGVTWQFLRALDDKYGFDDAMNYLDAVAVATVADITIVTGNENRTIIDYGLKNVTHPLFYALAEKANTPIQSLTGYDCQFGIIPLMNALIRVGKQDEKELLFKAMCCEYEYFNYKKRGTTEVIEESIYERVARLAVNAKARQKKIKTSDTDVMLAQIERRKADGHKILVVNGTDTDEQMTGMLASALADRFNKPCLVLRKYKDEYYTGSGRNSKISSVENLKPVLEETGLFDYVAGHNNAFGVKINRANVKQMIATMDIVLPDTVVENFADFSMVADDLTFDLVARVVKQVMPYVGTGFDTPEFIVNGIEVRRDMIKQMAAGTSIKITTDEDVDIVAFNLEEDDPVRQWYEWGEGNSVTINVVGECGMNFWNGMMTAQLIVREWEIE